MKNHVTFLITTELPLEDFDSAVIGDQRFEIKANLIEGLTKDEKEKLTQINNRLDYLEKKANEESNYYDFIKKSNLDADPDYRPWEWM